MRGVRGAPARRQRHTQRPLCVGGELDAVAEVVGRVVVRHRSAVALPSLIDAELRMDAGWQTKISTAAAIGG